MNRLQAATAIRNYLIERYALEDEPECNLPWIADPERSAKALGRELAGNSYNVIWESSEGYDWPHRITDQQFLGAHKPFPLSGIFLEPATGYALSIYLDR